MATKSNATFAIGLAFLGCSVGCGSPPQSNDSRAQVTGLTAAVVAADVPDQNHGVDAAIECDRAHCTEGHDPTCATGDCLRKRCRTDGACLVSTSGDSCALTGGGAVECWGSNQVGELGNNSSGAFSYSSVPVQVVGLTSDAIAVSSGQLYACAVTSGGGVECWGFNDLGQLGNNSTTNSSVPVQVVGLTSSVTSLSVGEGSACALTTGGGVECWGINYFGQLGNNSTTNSSLPVPVVGLTSGVTAVSVGGQFACVVTADGGVECWGLSSSGQLGNGSTTNSSVPVPVVGLTSRVTTVSAGGSSACALTVAGDIDCWGDNSAGQLGNNSTTNSSVPVPVVGLTSGVTAVSVGASSACAITARGAVQCWGGNYYGELGNGSTTNSSVPASVVGLTSPVTDVSVGSASACAVTNRGGVECWGFNDFGQLGNNSTTNSSVPVPVVGFP